jgi:aspartate/methionine/tyrosine aminotransferase
VNPLAKELNETIKEANNYIYEMLSVVGKNLFYPKGILTQSAEAKEKAHKFNATIGMATEEGQTMYLPSVMAMIHGLAPSEALTYAPSFGIMALRMAWKEQMLQKNFSLKSESVSLPVVTHAITHALSILADMWVDPGDALVLPDKIWGNYSMVFGVRRGAEIVNYPLFNTEGGFNLKGFEDCLNSEAEKRDKVIVILNFPNNPTGYTVTSHEGDDIAHILENVARRGTNVLAIADDAYFGLFYEDDVLNESIFTRITNRHPRLLAIKADGATKENYVWGLRVGFITYGISLNGDPASIYEALERKTAGAVRGSISNASHLGQSILLKSFQADTYAAEKKEKLQIMKNRAQEVKRVLRNGKYDRVWDVYPFNSGYFMCLKLKTVDAEELRTHLLNEYGVGLISLGKTDIRVAFSCIEKNDLLDLFDTIYQGIEDLEA